MNTWKVILATLIIFGAGVVTGGLLVNYSARSLQQSQRPPARQANPRVAQGNPNVANPNTGNPNAGFAGNRVPVPLPGPLRKEFVDRLDQNLSLTPAQRERIERIMSVGQEHTREAW